jgi:carbonic anhydrase/acetyltransferase-like protein (isoleucine patch superfamily)
MDEEIHAGVAAFGRGPVYSFEGVTPRIASDAFIAPSAAVIGNVEIGAGSSVWFHCVLRGDTNIIRVGARCNIQDGTIIHVDHSQFATIIGDDVSIGHAAIDNTAVHYAALAARFRAGLRPAG